MTSLVVRIEVSAPPERCFDLARSMDFHTSSMGMLGTRERIVGGVTRGLIGPRGEVEFEARHLGLRRRMRARIAAFDRPRTFTDEQLHGPFAALSHTHIFEPIGGGTLVTDRIDFSVKAWQLGVLTERWLVGPHLRRILTGHQQNLKRALEGGDADRYLAV